MDIQDAENRLHVIDLRRDTKITNISCPHCHKDIFFSLEQMIYPDSDHMKILVGKNENELKLIENILEEE